MTTAAASSKPAAAEPSAFVIPESDALALGAASKLPSDAPSSVVFGVVLVQYRGAQGATATARDRSTALALANDIAAIAKTDFAAAVAKGDPGSAENLGRIPQGIIESAPEAVLFGLKAGQTGGPVDTPRGYWIVRRVE